MDLDADIASVEDTILSKLNWSRIAGGLPKQETDVLEILRIRRDKLDMRYLNQQAKNLQLIEALHEQLNVLGWDQGTVDAETDRDERKV